MGEANVLEVLEYIIRGSAELGEGLPLSKEELIVRLQQQGFSREVLNKAFNWLGDLIKQQLFFDDVTPMTKDAIRIFTPEEIIKLSARCRSAILILEKMEVLDAKAREIVIHQLMQVNREIVDLEELKWVVTIVLLSAPDSLNLGEKISKLNLMLLTKKHEC